MDSSSDASTQFPYNPYIIDPNEHPDPHVYAPGEDPDVDFYIERMQRLSRENNWDSSEALKEGLKAPQYMLQRHTAPTVTGLLSPDRSQDGTPPLSPRLPHTPDTPKPVSAPRIDNPVGSESLEKYISKDSEGILNMVTANRVPISPSIRASMVGRRLRRTPGSIPYLFALDPRGKMAVAVVGSEDSSCGVSISTPAPAQQRLRHKFARVEKHKGAQQRGKKQRRRQSRNTFKG